MQLYFYQTDFTSFWSSANNWFTDASATEPYGAVPGSGDDVAPATAWSGAVYIDGDITVDLAVGTCTLEIVEVSAGATINSGNFTGAVTQYGAIVNGTMTGIVQFGGSSTTTGGTFSGDGCSTIGSASITGGTFSGANFTHGVDGSGPTIGGTAVFTGSGFTNNALISGGTFTCASFTNNNEISGGTVNLADSASLSNTISGGTINGNSVTLASATITGGIFPGDNMLLDTCTITGGTWTGANLSRSGGSIEGTAVYAPPSTVAFADLISGDQLQTVYAGGSSSDPGSFVGAFGGIGGYRPAITVTDLPSGGTSDILGTGLL